MYEFPYGAGQQLNLNWIINEIITLHKQLDPDYELPNFDNAFPYMNLNQLNLDWILRELKAIKDLAPTEDAQLLKMVANALIANTYDATTQYNVGDFAYRDSDNRLYKCIVATPAGGEPFDSNHWEEVKVGDVLTAILHEIINLSASDIANDSSVQGLTVKNALENILSNFFANNATYANEIENGTDYDNIRTAGNYYCTSTANAATMTNIPYAAAHRLTVISLTPYRIAQIIVFNTTTPSIYYRYYNGSVWGSWWRIDGRDRKILYSPNTPILTANNAEMARITDDRISADDTVLLSCNFSNPTNITSGVTWQSYNGYLTLTGTCIAATTADIVLSI